MGCAYFCGPVLRRLGKACESSRRLAFSPNTLDAGPVPSPRIDFALTPEQRADARSALGILTGSGLTLTGAAEIAVHRRRARKVVTADDAAALFLASRTASRARPATVRWYDDRLGPWLRVHGSAMMDEFTRPMLLDWINEHTAGARPGYLRALRALFRWCAAQEPAMVGNDPSRGLTLPKIHADHSIAFLSVDQCDTLLRGCGDHLGAVALSLFAGLRPDEVAGRGKPWLPWAEIHEAEQLVHVPAACSKTRKERSIEGLPPALWRWLATIPAGKRGATVSSARSRQIADRGRAVLGLDRWPADALRHTFATYAVALTSDAAKISLWLGHEGSTSLIHRHYRGLATKAQGESFFAIVPARTD